MSRTPSIRTAMSKLPENLWSAINRAKLDLRKYHLEKNPPKKALLREKAVLSSANADRIAGLGPAKYRSSRQLWRNEILYLNNCIDDDAIGPYWQDSVEHWTLDNVPDWAREQPVKVQEPAVGTTILVLDRETSYSKRVPDQLR